ncbi:MAG: hypothetical protein KatS3mg114_0193 [Planctomycetaceae bacterium]|nr:MAG: hypothetical protein KatS3mg114_0193 [Planctomycetaceae bacterium]
MHELSPVSLTTPTLAMRYMLPQHEPWYLQRSAWGELLLCRTDTHESYVVEPYRCFPWSNPDEWISFIGPDGRERLLLPALRQLPSDTRELLEQELSAREFIPHIRKILSSSSLWPPCVWRVVTDQGETSLQIESEDDVRKLPLHPGENRQRVLITAATGLRFLIPDTQQLDAHSQAFLNRLL